MGSVLVGSEVLISKARRWRKMLGGGLRQVGVVAAAGLYALEHNVQRLADDHKRASQLAEYLNKLEGKFKATAHTNMVFLEATEEVIREFQLFLSENEVIISGNRLVLHKDIDDNNLDRLFDLLDCFGNRN